MKKVWIYKRKKIKGWWVGWYESGKRKTKALPSKTLAEHFHRIKYAQLNSDVFTGTITIDWEQMRNEYQHSKKVAGNQDVSIYVTPHSSAMFSWRKRWDVFGLNVFS